MAASASTMTFGEQHGRLFQALFEDSRIAMLLVADDRRIVNANRAAAELTGYSQDELTTLHSDDLWEPQARPALPPLWDRMIASGSLCGTRNLRLADGGTVPMRYSATAEVGGGTHLLVYVPALIESDGPVVMRDVADPPLTRRQREIVTLLALGLTSAEIAERLFVSPDTVQTHIRNAMRATHSHNRVHLVAQALQRGWIVSTA